jgi:hypothetical protein
MNKGKINLTGGIVTVIKFPEPMPTADYIPMLMFWDNGGDQQPVQLMPGKMTTTQMSVQTLIDGTLYWKVEEL